MKSVRVLLIGVGGYGENYLKEMLEEDIPDAELVAIADPFASKSQYIDAVRSKGIPVFSSPADFYLKGGKADLAVISSPIHTHYDYTVMALENDSSVLVEKPVVINTCKMRELMEKEEKSGHFVAVGYQLCYSRHVQELKRDILSGMFGDPIRARSLRLMRRGDKYYARNGWAGKLSCHGDYVFDSPLSNACAHQVENMLYLLGPSFSEACDVTSVDGILYKGRPDIQNFDAAAIRMLTDTGIPLYYYTAHPVDAAKIGPMSTFEFSDAVIEESQGVFIAEFNDGRRKEYRPHAEDKRMQKLYDAIACVKSGERPACTLQASIGHISVVLKTEQLPVYLRYDAVRKSVDDDGYYSIPGLEDEFTSSYEKWKLPDRRSGKEY